MIRFPLVFAALVGCSDYDVAHSELVALQESPQISIVADETHVVTFVAAADGEAMASIGTSFLDLTTFAAVDDRSPRIFVTAQEQSVDDGVAPTTLLDLTVDDLFARCGDPDAVGPDAEETADGGCEVTVPVTVRVEGGDVTFQVDGHAQIGFGKDEPPGTLMLSVR